MHADADNVGERLESLVSETLTDHEATAFVHVGSPQEPAVRYCLSALEHSSPVDHDLRAVAFDGEQWLLESGADTPSHPAKRLASELVDGVGSGTVLTPARIPHDAALYLEDAGFDLTSTTVLERARAGKTATERERIAAAQRAATAGIERGASVLADAVVDDNRLVVDGESLTPTRLRTAIDEAVISAGAFPVDNTVINPGSGHEPSSRTTFNSGENSTDGDGSRTDADTGESALRPGEPIVLEVAPRGPEGYYGGLVRTLVVDGDGGRERRAHVGVTQSFQSARAMLTADTESVTRVEADLEAEVRAFGFGEADTVRTRVSGVGLEPHERPLEGSDQIDPGSVVRLESSVRVDDGQWLRIADLLVKGETGERPEWLAGPSRSLEPTALLEE